MGIGSGDWEHELKVGSTTQKFKVLRDENGKSLYSVETVVMPHRSPLKFVQTNWIGGHGQYTMPSEDAQSGRGIMYFDGQNIDTTVDGVFFLAPLITEVKENDGTALDSAVAGFYWYEAQNKWLCWTSGKVYLYGTTWTAATTTLAGVTDMCEFNGILYAAMGASTLYYYSSDGDTWTQTDLTDGYANYFVVAPNSAGTASVLWKAKTTNEVSNTTDGRTVAAGGVQWASPWYVGDTSHNITNIFLVGDKLKVGREDNEYYLDSSGGTHPERDDLKVNQSVNNFKYTTIWQTSLYHSEERGMGEITVKDTYNPMSPLYDADNIGKVGDVVGMAADKNWLYVAMDEGTDTHIYKGREVRRDGKLVWQWCPWVYLSTNVCSYIETAQHTTTDRRLWFGYGTSGTTTGYVILSDNPLSDSLARFATSGWIRFSYDYGSTAKNNKLYQSAIVDVAGGASGETWIIKYRKDTDTSMTALMASASTTNGITEQTFNAEVACNRIQFEIDLASDTSTATPQVRYFEAKGIEKPEWLRVHDVTYYCGDEQGVLGKTLRDLLRTGSTSTALIRFADLAYRGSTGGTAGTDFVYVVMEPGYPQEVEIAQLKGRPPEKGIRVRLREVTFS